MTDDSIALPKPTDAMPDIRLIERYLAGECTLPERVAMERWASANPQWRETLATLRHDGEAGRDGSAEPVDEIGGEQAIVRRIGDPRLDRRLQTERGTALGRVRKMGPSRAYALLDQGMSRALLGVGLSILVIVGILRLTSSLTPSRQAQSYSTKAGERSTIRLSDGSRVTLAPGTTVTLDRDFGHGTRALTLRGEAYFDVTAAVSSPFIVHTGSVTTEVLGTTFDIKRYPNDAVTRVVVTSGKVRSHIRAVGHQPRTVTVSSGMVATISDSTWTITTTDALQYVDWTRGDLRFRHTPVPEVLAMMERWYGLRFSVTDSALLEGTVTGQFDFPTAKDALDVLAVMLDTPLDVNRRGDTTVVTLRARRGGTSPAPTRRELHRTLNPKMEVGR